MFKMLASFENWHKLIVKVDKSITNQGEAQTETQHLESGVLRDEKEEFDRELTKFFDLISEKRENELHRFCDRLSTEIDELNETTIIEKVQKAESQASTKEGGVVKGHEENKTGIPQRSVNFQADKLSDRPPLKIIHFNDVYNIEENETEPRAGYARFYTALRSYDHLKPLILFSGDIFSPSKLSIFFEGEHMMPFVKKAGIHCACVGNHDFDFGEPKLGELILQTDFPWLLSNVRCAKTGKMLSNTLEHVVINHEGYRIALIGLAEVEWIETLADINLEDLTFEPPVACAKRFVKYFKQDRDDIDFLIALTHMRTVRDEILSREVPEIDLMLGGHDHHIVNYQINDTLSRKSGTDFREFSIINLSLHNKEKSEFLGLDNILTEKDGTALHSGVLVKDISTYSSKHKTLVTEFETVEVTSEFDRDPELHEHVVNFTKALDDKMKVI